MNKVLFLSYDGLLDPLGKSQIVPYIKNISKHQREVHIISFEKGFRIKNKKKINFKEKNIFWYDLTFSSNFGLFSKIYDVLKLFFVSLYICKNKKINIIHARSHISAYVAFFLKKIHKLKLIFDFRGFWLEERFENKLWNKNNFFYKNTFYFLKFLEKKTIFASEKLVVLTQKAKEEITKNLKKNISIKVIPCAVDYNLFDYKKFNHKKKNIKKSIGIDPKDIVVCYLGSLGGVYNVSYILNNFLFLKKNIYNISFLVITNNPQVIKNELKKPKYSLLEDKLKYFFLEREFLPKYLSIADMGLSFIQPGYSRIAQSPTRIAELLSMGIPVVCNKKIGDINEIISLLKVGMMINLDIKKNNLKILDFIKNLERFNKEDIRIKSKKIYSLDNANKKYKEIYNSL